ncbi:hypothetical protein [Roseovarius faecimaris]|nr:hypothetical protein [Roseovarius faecimaris]
MLSLALLASGTQVSALSCMRPDVVRTYTQAAEAEEHYVVVHGTLRFDEQRLPEAVMNESPPSTKIPARITGMALSGSRFDTPFDHEITLEVLCFGPWCAGASSGVSYLGFLEVKGGAYTLTVDPCGGNGFAEPTEEALRQVELCHAGGPCRQQTE